jgi:hypothetical protein
VETLRRWIAEGALWPDDAVASSEGRHWAFQRVRRPALPKVMDRRLVRSAIDVFVQARLAAEGLAPSPEADRLTLVRRLYLDLTGLPPTPEELACATCDASPDWYEKLVDRLLASPHFGERWGLDWLDLARYADSDGYEKDLPRLHAWRWREWLLEAVNRDLPFDEFTVQQIAGDLLPEADDNTRLATGFHRQALTNREGGIDQEEFRVKTVVDRVNTTFTAWLGLTVGCAECHSHKYDPITQREYYGLFAFFNSADESNIPLPLTHEEDEEFFQSLLAHAAKASKVEEQLEAATKEIERRQAKLERELFAEYRDRGDRAPREGLALHFPLDGDARDAVGGKLQGVYQSLGEVEWTEGRTGRAVALHGIGYFDFDTSFRFERDRPFSYGGWINVQGDGGLITKLDDANAFRGFDVIVYEGRLLVHLVHRWPDDAIRVIANDKLTADAWRHVFVTYDGSSKAAGLRIYVDGRLQPQTAAADTLANSIQNDQPLRIGSRSTSAVFRGAIDDVRIYDRALTADEVAQLAFDDSLLAIIGKPAESRTDAERDRILDFLQRRDAAAAPLRQQLDELERSTPQRPQPLGHVMAERPVPRATHVHLRGDFLKPGEEVTSHTPAFLPPLEPRGREADRLDLARWMVDRAHPLTARVAVNQVWAHLFGFGLVRTPEDFGAQGERPSHSDLLDWLAGEFVRCGWSRKRLIRLIVTSHTYRQSSAAGPSLAERDPENRLLARQNRVRLPGELVRDQYLAAAGLLNRRVGGRSFRPPLPPGVGAIQFVDQWQADSGAEIYRRGLYIHLQRNLMFPLLTTFDRPDAITICTRRERSNTPLQALAQLNGPTFVEAARQLGCDISAASDLSDDARIRLAYERTVARPPDDYELRRVAALLARFRALYGQHPDAAAQLVGENAVPAATIRETAAWIALARTLLNLDEAITRE